MKSLFLVSALMLVSFSSYGANLCTKFKDNSQDMNLVLMLAQKLSYTGLELCTNSRILDIQKEIRTFYYVDVDAHEDHTVLTLHYNEYSCEYHYNIIRESWMKQYCYNTF